MSLDIRRYRQYFYKCQKLYKSWVDVRLRLQYKQTQEGKERRQEGFCSRSIVQSCGYGSVGKMFAAQAWDPEFHIQDSREKSGMTVTPVKLVPRRQRTQQPVSLAYLASSNEISCLRNKVKNNFKKWYISWIHTFYSLSFPYLTFNFLWLFIFD